MGTTLNANDHQALQSTTIFCKLDNYGLLRVYGADAGKFLQGQLSCNIDKINPMHGALGAYTNLQGRLVSTFRIYQVLGDYYLRMSKDALQPAAAQLTKYAVFSKADVAIDTQHHIYGIAGNNAAAICKAIFNAAPEELNQQQFLGNACLINIGKQPPRFEYLVSQDNSDAMAAQLRAKCTEVSASAWRLLDIQAGIANIYRETLEKLLPHDVNFQEVGGLSFDKGCYLGQEIIARMHYRGKLKKRMYQVNFTSDKAIKPGQTVFSAQDKSPVGLVVDSVSMGEQEQVSLLVLPVDVDQTASLLIDNTSMTPNFIK